jgi:hypothetical protein
MSQKQKRPSPGRTRPLIEPGIRRRSRIVSPDRSRSALWDGTVDRGNTLVFDGANCDGPRLFACTLVLASSPSSAAQAADGMGMTAATQSLGATGSTGPRAKDLYFCKPVPSGSPSVC